MTIPKNLILPKLAILGGGKDALLFGHLFANSFEDIIVYCTNRKEKERVNQKVLQINGNTIILSKKFQSAYDLEEFSEGPYFFLFAEFKDPDKFTQIIKKLIPILKPQHHSQFLLGSTGIVKKNLRQKHKIFCYSEYLQGLLQQHEITNHSIGFIAGFSNIREVFHQNSVAFRIISDPLDLAESIHKKMQHEKISWIRDRDQDVPYRPIMKMEIHHILFDVLTIISYQLKKIETIGLSAISLLLEISLKEILKIITYLQVEKIELLISGNFLRSFLQPFYEAKREHLLEQKRKKPNAIHTFQIFRRFFKARSIKHLGETLAYRREKNKVGDVHLGRILEFAKENNLDLPFLKKAYEVIFHNKDGNTLLVHLNELFEADVSEHANVLKKNPPQSPMLYSIAGRGLERILIQKVNDQFLQEYANCEKIKNQARPILEILQKRIRKMEKRKIFSLKREYLLEQKLWQTIQENPVPKLERTLNRLIQFYIRNITDNFKPGIKTVLYLLHFPIRFTLNIIQRSRWPIVEGSFDRIQSLVKNTTLVYVPTHKSHLDSLEITLALLQEKLPIPRYAAASSLMTKRFWSLILRVLGAFSVDRERSHNILYLECLKYYSETLLQFGIPSLIFPEGTRSRNGSLGPIKTGLLSSLLEAFRNNRREIAVIPVSIVYSSIPEDQEFCQEAKRSRLSRYLLQRRKVIVHFSQPILVSGFAHERDGKNKLAQQILVSWKRDQTILKNQLLALMLDQLHQGKLQTLSFSRQQLIVLIKEFMAKNSHKRFETAHYETIITRGMAELIRNQIITQEETTFQNNEEILHCTIISPQLLKYYARMAMD